MTTNEAVAAMLRDIATKAEQGALAETIEEAYCTVLILVVQGASDCGVQLMSTLGALALAKANLMHEYHEIITRTGGTRPPE